MGNQPKPYESPLSDQLAEEILNIPVGIDGDLNPPRTIGEVVRRSVEMIARANQLLEGSQVAKIVARSLMQSLKKRGDAAIVVRYDGTVVLRVVYGEQAEDRPVPRSRKDTPAVQTTHRSDLPYLDDLRQEAESLGVDISHLGRQRRAIHEYLTAYKANLKPGVDEVRVTQMESLTVPRTGRRKVVAPPGDVDIGELLSLPVEGSR